MVIGLSASSKSLSVGRTLRAGKTWPDMDGIVSEASQANHLPPVVRSCDWCRSRKIRCDKKSPCSSCRQSRVPCERKLELREKTKSQRVLISPEYKEKLDRIDERLQAIIEVLMEMKGHSKSDVKIKQEQHSPLPLPHPLLVPGGQMGKRTPIA
ncbi:putative transcriptional regulatory protein [Colletotrichum orbiculare MAFF 240422]|uniref:Transcriptional regulatory protein n=1 Tax=Colletotrichum orbiculare (strain 104-T / ATCC 96160 / CBS 514.97 / LARS 414 / MAFF 240422) TaxID=1213857 RepID=A0A484FPI0_COLOR|nr:putative transcriptional regulatory protein [Colletotrichum orbiculare MAFF 240422]